jgi:hypothetical protein
LSWFQHYFLALIIADKTLFGIESLEDLLEIEILAGQNESKMRLILYSRIMSLTLPILRKCTKEKGATEEPTLKYAFLSIFRAMLRKARHFSGSHHSRG